MGRGDGRIVNVGMVARVIQLKRTLLGSRDVRLTLSDNPRLALTLYYYCSARYGIVLTATKPWYRLPAGQAIVLYVSIPLNPPLLFLYQV